MASIAPVLAVEHPRRALERQLVVRRARPPSRPSRSAPASRCSTMMPPSVWIGASSGCTTTPSGAGRVDARRGSRPSSCPVTVMQSPCSSPASRRCFITTGTPPTRSRSLMWNLPPGFMSAMCGTRAATRLKSSRSSATPASLAMASRWSTALVEPPRALVTAMAFSNAALVMIWRGVMPSSQHAARRPRPAARASSSRRRSTAGGDAEPGRLMPDRLGDRRSSCWR